MKIEIKPCNDRVRFTQPVVSMRLENKNGPHTPKPVRRGFAPGLRRKTLAVRNLI
jgi:hypothetical protein